MGLDWCMKINIRNVIWDSDIRPRCYTEVFGKSRENTQVRESLWWRQVALSFRSGNEKIRIFR
ncbi:MAG: hypothetical protein ACD_62C00237G0001 [uncultured bacterium]|nr:MAG: hypothetical protein ACD_62C00237G0001 [uncultured bacterium]